MPLPFILGGLAIAAIAGAVIIGIMEFYDRVKRKKRQMRAVAARIKAMYDMGDYVEVDVGLENSYGEEIDSMELKVKEEEAYSNLREGMTL
ncbi:hypothetical protein NHP200010_03120 [Helicobacter bizzozeronii]|uniref:hypothetical protein n=1 Tax=Helicobacter bizzozeronii TaxID=56877 RepID=UPI00244D833D|nr:hypothetical protein [Helicobacter bizzozeronii]GMB92601.1 hypothetical protein NHP200010_03120 [Helicobacter bizzozeronii]